MPKVDTNDFMDVNFEIKETTPVLKRYHSDWLGFVGQTSTAGRPGLVHALRYFFFTLQLYVKSKIMLLAIANNRTHSFAEPIIALVIHHS